MGCAFAAAAPASHATHYRINALVKHSRQPLRAWYQKEVPPAVTWVNEAFDNHRFACYRSRHTPLSASERNVDG
jgi:hypothetical protein